jgi:hypothetical protein
MQAVRITPLPARRFEDVLEPGAYRSFGRTLGELRPRLTERRLWNVSSSSRGGGGVAELLRSLLGYLADVGVDVCWAVVDGDDEFFEFTKRVHNCLHGLAGPDPSAISDDPEQRTVGPTSSCRRASPRASVSPSDVEDPPHDREPGWGDPRPDRTRTVGLLLDDPTDLSAFGDTLSRLLGDGDGALRMGREAHRRVRDRYLAPRELGQLGELLARLDQGFRSRRSG